MAATYSEIRLNCRIPLTRVMTYRYQTFPNDLLKKKPGDEVASCNHYYICESSDVKKIVN